MKKYIPNFITSLNLFSGCIATVMAVQGEYLWVVIWVVIAAIFDFLDGFFARLLKVNSPAGKELDSLADVVSFGFAPSMAVFIFLKTNTRIISENPIVCEYLPYIAFLIVIFSALRLAKFNVDTRQSDSFIGLNTTSNAPFWVSLCYGIETNIPVISASLMYIFIGAIIVFSLLLVSELPMFSLKVKNWKLKGNEYRYLLALFIIVMVSWIGILGISAGVLLYIVLSIINNRNKDVDTAKK